MTARSVRIAALLLIVCSFLSAQSTVDPARLQWFADAKLGIFIHYGIYAVNGIDESWSFFNEKVTYDDYMRQLNGFTASKYDPAVWADLFARSGARYVVMTSKHHDGVALWGSSVGGLNVVTRTPAKRDLVKPFVEAIRSRGMKAGLYFSLLDWSHPDYTAWTRSKNRYAIAQDTARWSRFLAYVNTQLGEVDQRYHPDLWWFDGDWEHSAEEWKASAIRARLLASNPNAVINSRLQGYGDYATPEQGVPIIRPNAPVWELCMTINDSWGFQGRDTNFKTPNQVIRIFADCIGLGGNLLLDVGPKEDGTIPPQQVAVLEELGRWTKKHATSIYGSKGGLPPGCFYGPTTISSDSTHLYLFLTERPTHPVPLKGLVTGIKSMRVVGTTGTCTWDTKMKLSWSNNPGIVYVTVPPSAIDPQITVVDVELAGPVQWKLFQ